MTHASYLPELAPVLIALTHRDGQAAPKDFKFWDKFTQFFSAGDQGQRANAMRTARNVLLCAAEGLQWRMDLL